MHSDQVPNKSVAIIGTRGYPSYYGGFETAVRKLAPALAEQGWQVIVYGRKGALRASPEPDARINSVITRGIESRSLSTLTYGLTSSVHAIFHKPDVALVMNVANGFWLPFLKWRGIPTLVNVDGIEWDRAKWGKLAKAVFRYGAKLTARFGTRLVFDARAIGERWKADFDRDGVFIPYGGDSSAELPIEAGLVHRGYILAVARFVPENSIPEFFEAARKLSTLHTVIIVGSTGYGGALDDEARALAVDSDRVIWLGHVSDDARLNSLWQHAGAYFHGHTVGGTNPALVQAMALGTPIVARDTVYNREVLGPDGVYVAGDAASIANALQIVISQPDTQEKLAQSALERAAANYTWHQVNGAYATQLLSLREQGLHRRTRNVS